LKPGGFEVCDERIEQMGVVERPRPCPCGCGELIGERRSTGERKYYISNLPAGTPLNQSAAAIKARWVCEQAPQQLKEELGLDHFEGRSWTGFAMLASIRQWINDS
jgi:SRSO17 transposase